MAAFFIIIGFYLYSTFLAKIKALWRRKSAIQPPQFCIFAESVNAGGVAGTPNAPAVAGYGRFKP